MGRSSPRTSHSIVQPKRLFVAGRGLQTDSRLAALLTCSHLFVCKTKSGQDFGIEQRSLKSLRILYSV
jgi:hypothetical protein